MPSPIISVDLRAKWNAISDNEIIAHFKSKNLIVELKNRGNRHFKITGSSRPVELYATTGTVNASFHDGKKPASFKKMPPARAFERVVSLANIGH